MDIYGYIDTFRLEKYSTLDLQPFFVPVRSSIVVGRRPDPIFILFVGLVTISLVKQQSHSITTVVGVMILVWCEELSFPPVVRSCFYSTSCARIFHHSIQALYDAGTFASLTRCVVYRTFSNIQYFASIHFDTKYHSQHHSSRTHSCTTIAVYFGCHCCVPFNDDMHGVTLVVAILHHTKNLCATDKQRFS